MHLIAINNNTNVNSVIQEYKIILKNLSDFDLSNRANLIYESTQYMGSLERKLKAEAVREEIAFRRERGGAKINQLCRETSYRTVHSLERKQALKNILLIEDIFGNIINL